MHFKSDAPQRPGAWWLLEHMFSWLAHSPQAAVGAVTLLTGHSVYVGASFTVIVANLVLLALAVAALRLVVVFLPDVWRVVFVLAASCLVSMLTMGWCVTNDAVCRATFVHSEMLAGRALNTTLAFFDAFYAELKPKQ